MHRVDLQVILIALAVSACGTDVSRSSNDAAAPFEPTIDNIQRLIFTPSCAVSGCHTGTDPEMSLDLTSVASSCAGLISRPSCLFRGRTRVLPGDPERSFLYMKLMGHDLGTTPDTSCGGDHDHKTSGQMPPAAMLPGDSVDLVRAWIAAGASCDGFVAPEPTDAGVHGGEDATTVADAAGQGHLVLAEVFFDAVGPDDGLEWVVLENTGSAPVDLAGYSLGAGTSSTSSYLYTTAQLSGTVAPGACFTVGGPLSNSTNGAPSYAQVFHFTPNLPNGGTNAAGVALFAVSAGNLAHATIPVDAVVYNGTNATLGGPDGLTAVPVPGRVPAGSSLRRASLATWTISSTPSPTTCPQL